MSRRLVLAALLLLTAAAARADDAAVCAAAPAREGPDLEVVAQSLGRHGRLLSCIYRGRRRRMWASVVVSSGAAASWRGGLYRVIEDRSDLEQKIVYESTRPFAVLGVRRSGAVWLIKSRTLLPEEDGSYSLRSEVFLTTGTSTRQLFVTDDTSSGDGGESWDTFHRISLSPSGRINVTAIERYVDDQGVPFLYRKTETKRGYWNGEQIVYGSSVTVEGYFIATPDGDRPANVVLNGRLCRDEKMSDCEKVENASVTIVGRVTADGDEDQVEFYTAWGGGAGERPLYIPSGDAQFTLAPGAQTRKSE